MPDGFGFQPPKEQIPAKPVFFIDALQEEVNDGNEISEAALIRRQPRAVRVFRWLVVIDTVLCLLSVIFWLGILRMSMVACILLHILLLITWSRPPRWLLMLHVFANGFVCVGLLVTWAFLIWPLSLSCLSSSCSDGNIAWGSLVLARFLWDLLLFLWMIIMVGNAYLAWHSRRSFKSEEAIDIYLEMANTFSAVDCVVELCFFALFGWSLQCMTIVHSLASLFIVARWKQPSRKAYIFHVYMMAFGMIENGFRAVLFAIALAVGSGVGGNMYTHSNTGVVAIAAILTILMVVDVLLFFWRGAVLGHSLRAFTAMQGKKEYAQSLFDYLRNEPKVICGIISGVVMSWIRPNRSGKRGPSNPSVAPA